MYVYAIVFYHETMINPRILIQFKSIGPSSLLLNHVALTSALSVTSKDLTTDNDGLLRENRQVNQRVVQ